jgi:hypothetical protein
VRREQPAIRTGCPDDHDRGARERSSRAQHRRHAHEPAGRRPYAGKAPAQHDGQRESERHVDDDVGEIKRRGAGGGGEVRSVQGENEDCHRQERGATVQHGQSIPSFPTGGHNVKALVPFAFRRGPV